MMRVGTSRRSRGVILGAALSAVVAMLCAGCAPGAPAATPTPSFSSPDAAPSSPSPTPTPDPTRPALAELVLTTEGLGTLVVGEVIAEGTELSMGQFVENYCDFGFGTVDPAFDRWTALPEYESSQAVYGGGLAFGLGVDASTSVLDRIDVFTPEIPTEEGIRFFSTRADVVAAYPAVVPFESDLTDVFEVPGRQGVVHIEVSTDDRFADYWPADELDTVIALRVVSSGIPPFSVAASGNVPPFCS